MSRFGEVLSYVAVGGYPGYLCSFHFHNFSFGSFFFLGQSLRSYAHRQQTNGTEGVDGVDGVDRVDRIEEVDGS